MNDNGKSIVVQELFPRKSGLVFKTLKAPRVDDARVTAYGMDRAGCFRPLTDEGARDAAVGRGERLFAVAKKHVDFEIVFPNVCKADGYDWGYCLSGVIKISDGGRFLAAWTQDGNVGDADGMDSGRFVRKTAGLLEPLVRDLVRRQIKNGYSVSEVEEKDVLPADYLSGEFSRFPKPWFEGLRIDVYEKAFVSQSAELDAALKAAEEARGEEKERGGRTSGEGGARPVGGSGVDEAERNVAVRKYTELMESLRFQSENLRNDIEAIRQAIRDSKDGASRLEAMKDAMAEAESKMKESAARMDRLSDRLSQIGARPHESSGGVRIDPAVAPRYQGMSDGFFGVMAEIRGRARNAVTMTYQVRDPRLGHATRAIIPDVYTARTLGGLGDGGAALRLGDGITVRLTSDRSGYLTLINFGTAPGAVNTIFPDRNYGAKSRRIEARRHYVMPGDLIPCPASVACWPVQGATTSEYGLRERVLAIVTDDDVEIDVARIAECVSGARARGGFEAVENSVSSVLDLPDGSWGWGLLEADVTA